jgi:hypothetical protein
MPLGEVINRTNTYGAKLLSDYIHSVGLHTAGTHQGVNQSACSHAWL